MNTPSQPPRRPRTSPPPSFRPLLEALEDRRLLATLYLAPNDVPFALVGRQYSLDIEGYGPNPDSHGPYTYTHPAGVAGLTFTTNGNVLTLGGTPTGQGTFPSTVDVRDQAGDHGQRQFTLHVCTPSLSGINLCIGETAATLPAGTAGVPYSVVLNAAGGNGNYIYTLPASVNG